ncbi:MAG: aminoglycoside phosphotransferase family protein [Ruminiclostridium sp.]
MNNLGLITDVKSYTVIEKITEGQSGDEKYKLEKDGEYFLLRIGNKASLIEKKQEYERLMKYVDKNINTHKPIVFNTTADKFYSIVSWVDGISVMDIIKNDVSKNYYQLGKKVGIELLKLHSVSINDSKADWEEIVREKALLFLENYRRMNIEFACSKCAEQYILKHIGLMSGRPMVILHGDFHWNNCVVDEKGNVGIIDFSGNSVGDPWYDFGGLLWALEYSNSFANGQIDGYFNTPPSKFWGIFKFYVALYAFEHLTYNDGTPEDIRSRVINASRMLRIFGDEFELELPLFRKI